MPSTSTRLLVVDQSLKGFEGHHYDYSRAVIEAARELGLETSVASHVDFAGQALAGAAVTRCFSGDWNSAGRSFGRTLMRGALERLPAPARRMLLSVATPRGNPGISDATPNPRFAREFLGAVSDAKLGEADHVLVHTVGEAEFLGLADALSQHPGLSPRIHVVLRYDGTTSCQQAFAKLEGTPTRLTYWTDTEQLAEHYRELGCREIGVLPIPHGLNDIPARVSRGRTPLTVSYLGGARGDKGFHLLPELVASFSGDYLATGKVQFLVQSTYGISREEGLMEATKRRLRRFPRDWLKLIEAPPDSETFTKALLSTDLLLLPYDQTTYRRRSSGLLVQAMVAGIPTILPEGTWLASAAPQGAYGAFGGTVTLNTALRHVVANYEKFKQAAQMGAPQAREQHKAERLVRVLVS